MTKPRSRLFGVPLRHSIGTRLFVGFVFMSIVTAALGGYGLYSLAQVGAIVADIFDHPLMATNYAGVASFTFAEMDKEAVRHRFAAPADRPAIDQRLSDLTDTFTDDLSVAEQRTRFDAEREAIRQIGALVRQWRDLREADEMGNAKALDDLSDAIAARFDALSERTLDDSFLERRQSVLAIQRLLRANLAALALVFVISLGITLYLARRISKPLGEAASIAERIGHGDLLTPVPPGGRDETGILLNSLTVMRDRIRGTMEREQAQARSAQARLVDAVESSEDGMVLVDATGRIVLANERFTKLFLSVAGVLDGTTENDAREAGGLAPWLESPFFEAGGEIRLPDGRWIRISRSPTREGGFFMFLGDITDLKEREERFKEAKIAAEAASIAKSQFLANMSHELRTPLNAIIGFSDMFIGEYFGPLGDATYRQYAAEINGSGWRLLEIIQNVLDLSHSQSGSLELRTEPHDLRETVEESRRPLVKICADAGLDLAVSVPAEPLMVKADAEKLRRVLNNLTSNAVKFTKPGGRVAIEAAAVGTTVRLSVADTGIGIPPGEIPLAFSAFSQIDGKLNRRYEGTGLGLPLAKAFVELHGGEITLDSEPGKGTVATVVLARLAMPAVAAC